MSRNQTYQLEEVLPGNVDAADTPAEKRFFFNATTQQFGYKNDLDVFIPIGLQLADATDDQPLQTADGAPHTIATYSTLADQKAISLKVTVWARETATQDSAKYVIEALFNRDGSSVVTNLDETFLVAHEDQAAWDVTFNISSQDIEVQVTGEAGKTIEWRCQLEVSEHG